MPKQGSIVTGREGIDDWIALLDEGGSSYLRVQDVDDGCLMYMADGGMRRVMSPDHSRALGKFLVEMFMGSADEHIKAIEDRVAFAIGKLEVWNERARADEEHPPYDDITTNLRDIQRCLDELKKGVGE